MKTLNRFRKRVWAPAWILCLGVAMLAGCEATGGNNSRTGENADGERRSGGVGLVPRAQSPIADVPVPVGFHLVESISRHYTVGEQRFIDHTYEGRESKFDVERFYRERMPLKDWQPKGEQMVRGRFEQRYRKADELAQITVDSSRNAFGIERTRVSITIRPAESSDGSKGEAGENNNA